MMSFTRFLVISGLIAFVYLYSAKGQNESGPYFASGIKIGEVTADSAIVWCRLTERPTRNPEDGPMVNIVYETREGAPNRQRAVTAIEYPDGITVNDIAAAVPGQAGQVRLLYAASGGRSWSELDWQTVEKESDFTHAFHLENLNPGIRYRVRLESRIDAITPSHQYIEGSFLTAPKADAPSRVSFAVSTGQRYPHRDSPNGFKIYSRIMAHNPDFFVHTGDIVYYDELAKTKELARYHWQRTYSLPSNREFHRLINSYFIKDDHDVWLNDCWPTMQSPFMHEFTFQQGMDIFREQVPMSKRTYRTFRWGKDLQIWLVEGRDFRSPNPQPDGPDKTIWGTEQKEWFKNTVEASDASFRVLISPTPIVGPDRTNKNDNHANPGFTFEGDEIRSFLAARKNMVVICGDRHWQYFSVDPETGVREYSCGPASDEHAGGWSQDNFVEEYHRYLNVIGGFLTAEVDRIEEKPQLTVRFHDVDGEVRFTDIVSSPN